MTGLADFVESPTETLHLFQIEYEESYGDVIVHLWCRTQDGERRHVEVEGHNPSFYIRADSFNRRIKNHDWVEGASGGWTTIHGEPLVNVEARLPKHVGGGRDIDKGLREYFDETWEADVFFTSRFLIDTGIHTHFEVDLDETWSSQHHRGDYRVDVNDIEAVDPDWRADPRMITTDIEVLSPDGFPEAADAEQPVTAITAYDNYDEEYVLWVLRYEGWAYSDTEVSNLAIENRPDTITVDDEEFPANIADVRVYEEETALLHDYNEYIKEREPDLLGGWNSSATMKGDAFDYPYLLNRCKSLNVSNYRDWSPMEQVWTTRRGREQNLTMGGKGVGFFDMMEAYKKTQWQEPKGGWGLSNTTDRELSGSQNEAATVKESELDMDDGKLDIEDIDEGWKSDPATFLEYNIRDVQAVVGIDAAAGVTDLFQNIRALAGIQFQNCHNNIDLIDVLVLRYAKQLGIALPTNEKPERSWYYGAHVFEPKLGLHENVVYPDLRSMYPSMIRNANMSPETLVGTAEDLEASDYTEDDCRWTYIDTRCTDVKEESDPRYEKVYFLKPSVQEGFLTQVVDDLMVMKDDYDGTALYDAVKRIVNSIYGVFGDSDSYGKGYRLFDWRIAEGITLGGRKMIQDSSGQFVDALNDIKDERGLDGNKAYRVGGDSVPSNEPTLVRRDGDVQIVSIENVTTGDEVWTDSCWSGVQSVIQKPNRKQLYTVWTKHGITHVTEDHGLIRDSGEEVTPSEVCEGEPLLHRDVADVDVSGMSMEEERAWLLGLFAAEGSCGIYECESGAKASWAINNQNRELLERAQDILSETFGVQTKIDDVMESSNTMKLRLDKCGDNASVVLGFREMLYDGTEKRVPKEVLNGSGGVQRAFVAGHHAGDGHIAHDHKEFDELWTKHKHLAAGLAFLLRQLGHTVSMHVRTEQSDEFYRIRSVAFTVGNDDEILGIEEYDYDGDYVYDLETENHHFQSGVGSMIVHNTDSVMTSIPFMEVDYENDGMVEFDVGDGMVELPAHYQQFSDIVDLAHEAADRVNDWYSEWTAETFNLTEGDHYCELEIESYAPRAFIPEGVTKKRAKKRYAELIAWDEGEWEDPLSFSVTGIDIVRSDRAPVTREILEKVLDTILREDDREAARRAIYDRINEEVEAIRGGARDNEWIARPKGMSNHPSQYGSPTHLPMPTYKGAKYANEYLDHERLTAGDKPALLYLDRVRGQWPQTYPSDWETKEAGDAVTAIAANEPNKVPDEFVVDMDKQIEKVLEDPLTPILAPMRWDFDECVSDTEHGSLASFM